MSSTEGSASASAYKTRQILASCYWHYKRSLKNQITVLPIFFYSSSLNHGEVLFVLNISIYNNITIVLPFTGAKTSHSNFKNFVLASLTLDMRRLQHKCSVIKILFFYVVYCCKEETLVYCSVFQQNMDTSFYCCS